MKYSEVIKPVSYLKAHASELIRDISKTRETMIITHNGEARAVLQDIHVYEEIQESLAMLKIVAQSSQSFEQGRFKPLREALDDIEQKITSQNKG